MRAVPFASFAIPTLLSLVLAACDDGGPHHGHHHRHCQDGCADVPGEADDDAGLDDAGSTTADDAGRTPADPQVGDAGSEGDADAADADNSQNP